MSHYNSTGPEIWEQTSGKIDGFTCAVGTGGTLSGTGLFLKEKNKNIKIALTDPYGSGLYNYYENGEMKAEGNSITEGIGQGRVTKNLENCPVDLSFRTDDNQALNIIFDLLKEEGLFLGGSSGINVAGAIKLAKELGPGKTIVTILCDSGQRYQSKIWNPSFLKSKDLVVPNWLQKEID
jgi:cysteine synthase A